MKAKRNLKSFLKKSGFKTRKGSNTWFKNGQSMSTVTITITRGLCGDRRTTIAEISICVTNEGYKNTTHNIEDLYSIYTRLMETQDEEILVNLRDYLIDNLLEDI